MQVSILRPQAFVVPQEGRVINPIRDSIELALTRMPLKPKSMEVMRTQNGSYSKRSDTAMPICRCDCHLK